MPASFTQDFVQTWLSQGCLPVSLYDKGDPSHGYYGAFGAPNGRIFPFVELGMFLNGDLILNDIDPYANKNQSTNLRVIQSLIKPHYSAKNDTLEFNADWAVTPSLTLTSQTGYNKDFLYSTEDFNRFDTAPGIFSSNFATAPDWRGADPLQPDGMTYCDPQLDCSQSMVGQDISQEHAWQLSQELRLASNFSGPFNFSVGANYMHYQTVEDYYVLFNLITAQIQEFDGQDAGQYTYCNSGTDGSLGVAPSLITPEPLYLSIRQLPALGIAVTPGLQRCCLTRHQSARHLYRSQSARQSQRAGAQLFPQRKSLCAEFLCRVRRGLLSGHARSETDGRVALDRRPEDLLEHSKLGV